MNNVLLKTWLGAMIKEFIILFLFCTFIAVIIVLLTDLDKTAVRNTTFLVGAFIFLISFVRILINYLRIKSRVKKAIEVWGRPIDTIYRHIDRLLEARDQDWEGWNQEEVDRFFLAQDAKDGKLDTNVIAQKALTEVKKKNSN